MERYVPKHKGQVVKTIIFIIVIVGIVLFFKFGIHKKIFKVFSSENGNSNNSQLETSNNIERKLYSLNRYDIRNYPADSIKNIKLAAWIKIVQNRFKLYYTQKPLNVIFVDSIYSLTPRWCYVVGNVLITKKNNKYYLILDIRRPDVVTFKFKNDNQIYRANTPTLTNINIYAKFYGMKNKDEPAVFSLNNPVTLKSDAQQPSKRLRIEIDPVKTKGFKFLIIDIKGFKYFVFK